MAKIDNKNVGDNLVVRLKTESLDNRMRHYLQLAKSVLKKSLKVTRTWLAFSHIE